ncbi:S1C family serine protease [Amycolatopsis sp. PS_44_ISF1]|uniref:S1C family serine protease n=1 Tax=Amycolatopsis sp. PS_44_ISF1 TaxID=2974917 RepID=UPI0028DE75FB|nr:S1C family serine protease [Amycolatopsis sp. PS_44_ISF1]MDT8911832.1 S1C family serine protease [Amycolatopsis sp. PS_44_ISF1]
MDGPLGAPWARHSRPVAVAAPLPAAPGAGEAAPRRRRWHGLGIAAVVVLLAVLAGVAVEHYRSPAAPPPAPASAGPAGIDVAAVAAKVGPSLVNIEVKLGLDGGGAAGTGIVLSADGLVLTNNHVVEGAVEVRAVDAGRGRPYPAAVLGYDRSHDIAVLKLDGASGMTPAQLGDSAKVLVGAGVVGLGNAGGLGGKPVVSPGRVTALGQSITASDETTGATETLTGLIQVDADIRSGDSGGSLADSQGRVIGVDTASGAGYQFDEGQRPHEGYAIPINQAAAIAAEIVAGRASSTVHIGPSAFLGLTVVDGGNGSGALIKSLVAGGPAAKIGLKPDLLVVAIDGQPVGSATALITIMDTHHPGDQLKVTVAGGGGRQATATVVPDRGPVG